MSYSVGRNQKAKLAADYNDLLKELASPKLKSIGCYTLGETIGRGSYGKVRLAKHQLTCRLVAIKQISKKHAPLMAREIHHHRQLHHPNIVSLYEILTTETSIFIVSEHCPHGDLFDALARKGRFSESDIRNWFIQLTQAIKYCHSLGIIHRDLKLENILLDENYNVKICDFGFARQTDKNQMLKTFCGSLAYSAPEVIQRQNYSGPETDIWSLGVILYTLLAGELPFDDDCESMLQKKVISTDYIIPDYFSEEVTDLLSKILKRDPLDRLNIQQIMQHPWLQKSDALIQPSLPSRNIQQEQETAHLLLRIGFDNSVVERMKQNNVGMLGTLWTMLLSKSHNLATTTISDNSCATQTEEQTTNTSITWMGSFKSWFNSTTNKPQKSSMTPPNQSPMKHSNSSMQQHKLSLKSTTASPIVTTISPSITEPINTTYLHPAFKEKPNHNTVLPLTPIHLSNNKEKEEIINSSSTCSSTADDEFDEDDHSSIDSSPATSVAEEEDDMNSITEKINNLQHHDFAINTNTTPTYINDNTDTVNNDMAAFHRVSPMPSRVDLLVPRSRYNIDEQRNNNLRNRLENKIIIEEDEEEDNEE